MRKLNKMILLIFPPFTEQKSEYLPLGIAQLAAVLEKNNQKVDVLDLGLYDIDEWKSHLSKKLDEVKPDIIGISSLTTLYKNACDVARFVKEKSPNIKILFGGVHSTVQPDKILKEDFVDYVIRGEGEYSLLELVRGDDLDKIKGLSYKKEGKIFQNPNRELIQDLDSLPFPARHLFDLKKYSWYPELSLISSRGCPFPCYYCFSGTFGKKFRFRSAENIVQEIEQIIKNYGVKRFYFYDDLFTLNKERVIDFCNLIIKKNINIKWRCCSRIDTIDKERLDYMKKAGCEKIHYGIESGDPELIKKIKGITLQQAKNAIKLTRKAGIESRCYFMIGHPWDTKKTIKNTISFSKKIDADLVQFAITTPFPSTELWDIAKDMGVVNDKIVGSEDFSLRGNKPIMRTETLSSEQLLKLYKKAERGYFRHKILISFMRPNQILKAIKRRGIIPVLKSLIQKIK
jgi:anaerobic magnesium-protoporphyrin IX monomethyl ester cyclase